MAKHCRLEILDRVTGTSLFYYDRWNPPRIGERFTLQHVGMELGGKVGQYSGLVVNVEWLVDDGESYQDCLVVTVESDGVLTGGGGVGYEAKRGQGGDEVSEGFLGCVTRAVDVDGCVGGDGGEV